MNDIEKIIRRTVSSIVDDVVNYVVTGSAKFLEKIRIYLPKYELTMFIDPLSKKNETDEVKTRFFILLNPRKKGKQAVYISQVPNETDMFISYLSKKDVSRLMKDNDLVILPDLIGDRWIVTIGRYKFDTSFQLFGCLVAVEEFFKPSNRFNKPPSGEDSCWIAAGCLDQKVFNYTRSAKIHSEISNVILKRYSIEEKLNNVQ